MSPQQDAIRKAMLTKDQILNEIRRLAKQNGGVAPGVERFKSETGIAAAQWGRHWVRWGDAVAEAGLARNQLAARAPDDSILEALARLARKVGHFPTTKEVAFHRRGNQDFPTRNTTFTRYGGKAGLVTALRAWCEQKGGLEDVIQFCDVARVDEAVEEPDDDSPDEMFGEVYLVKSGRRFKIGMTKSFERRMGEFSHQLAEPLEFVHSFKTDDPSGIEAYWHRRFADKRKNGEWFELSSADISAFRRRKKFM
jgi:hypothetical protein